LEEISGNFLSGSEFRTGSVFAGIEIDPQSFFFDR
jgi:hypothetical protein